MRELNSDERGHILFKSFLNFGGVQRRLNVSKSMLNLCSSTTDFILIKYQAHKACDYHREIVKSRRKLKKEFKEPYDKIIDTWACVADSLKIEQPLELSFFYTLLLWDGYFSKNRVLRYQEDNRANLSGWYSLDVMCGNGVCLNFSDLLKDLLLRSGVDAALLINYVEKMKSSSIAKELVIRRKIKASNQHKFFLKLMTPILKKHGNHAFVVIRDQDKIFGYDPTNLLCANIANLRKAETIDGVGTFDLKVNDSYAYACSNREFSLLDDIITVDGEIPFTKQMINDAWINAYYKFKRHRELLDDCYNYLYPSVKDVADKIIVKKRK